MRSTRPPPTNRCEIEGTLAIDRSDASAGNGEVQVIVEIIVSKSSPRPPRNCEVVCATDDR